MGKITKKLIAALLAVLLSVTMLVISSYAWMIRSTSPQIEGIYVSVGGGNTILLAADMVVEENGQTYHFPGTFSDRLNFSQYESYDYLKGLGGLTPVSTADGLHWYLPAYYKKNDPLVKAGTVQSGQIKPFSEFTLDDRLIYANLTQEQQEQLEQGSYVYLDFWVVSPGQDYRLHLSTGEETDGSFVIGLPKVTVQDSNGDTQPDTYTLSASGSEAAAASVRVGFLANQTPVTDLSMFYYQCSEQFAARYTQLRGVYAEKYVSSPEYDNRFLIYEPNATAHTAEELRDSYVITQPLGKTETGVGLADISSRLTVQSQNTYLMAENGTQTRLQQAFEAAAINEEFNEQNLQEVSDKFYKTFLQEQLAAYVNDAGFYTHTGNLYALQTNGVVDKDTLAQNAQLSGATEDIYIVDLEKNIPQRLRMFIWLEGQDIDCTNDAQDSGIAINIELAGSSYHG